MKIVETCLSLVCFPNISSLLPLLFSFSTLLLGSPQGALGERSKKNIAMIYSKECLPMFSSGSFMVLGLTFRSLIHFEFIFVYGVIECSKFILLHVAVQFPQHHLLKRLSFLHCIFLPPLS